MHDELLKVADIQQLKSYVYKLLGTLKESGSDLYDEAEILLYKEINGCHFNKYLVEKAVASMENEDGSIGEHWSLDQTNKVAQNYGVKFDKFNEYDWYYVMNMIYSDYFGAVPDELSYYAKMSIKFLNDKDADSGKAFRYWEKL